MALNLYLPSSTTATVVAPGAGACAALGLTALQARGVRGAGIRIGLVDSGVDTRCAGLAGARIITLDRTGAAAGGMPILIPHGTWMAGIMVGKQIAICPDAAIVSVQAFTAPDSGYLADGIDVALKNNVDIINISGGQVERDPRLTELVQRACDDGVVVVAAADNTNPMSSLYPACQGGVLGVTNGSLDGILVHPGVPSWVRLAGLGVGVTTYQGDVLVRQTGTSEATAVVSAVCALLLGVVPAARRREAGKQLSDVLYSTGAPTANSKKQCRVVQPARALDEICRRFAVALHPAAVT